jgi:hypothetical protein
LRLEIGDFRKHGAWSKEPGVRIQDSEEKQTSVIPSQILTPDSCPLSTVDFLIADFRFNI